MFRQVSEQLKPCPFCGETDSSSFLIKHLEGTVSRPAYKIVCDTCGASTCYSDKGDHINIWNSRSCILKDLNWTDHSPPNEECSYDHVCADSVLGRYSIEWKSWKEHDSYGIFLNGDYLGSEYELEKAKDFAFGHFKTCILSVLR